MWLNLWMKKPRRRTTELHGNIKEDENARCH